MILFFEFLDILSSLLSKTMIQDNNSITMKFQLLNYPKNFGPPSPIYLYQYTTIGNKPDAY